MRKNPPSQNVDRSFDHEALVDIWTTSDSQVKICCRVWTLQKNKCLDIKFSDNFPYSFLHHPMTKLQTKGIKLDLRLLLRADVSKYRPEVYKSEKSKTLKKIHKVALGKLLT